MWVILSDQTGALPLSRLVFALADCLLVSWGLLVPDSARLVIQSTPQAEWHRQQKGLRKGVLLRPHALNLTRQFFAGHVLKELQSHLKGVLRNHQSDLPNIFRCWSIQMTRETAQQLSGKFLAHAKDHHNAQLLPRGGGIQVSWAFLCVSLCVVHQSCRHPEALLQFQDHLLTLRWSQVKGKGVMNTYFLKKMPSDQSNVANCLDAPVQTYAPHRVLVSPPGIPLRMNSDPLMQMQAVAERRETRSVTPRRSSYVVERVS